MQGAEEPTALAGMRSMVDVIVDDPYVHPDTVQTLGDPVPLINPYGL